MIARTRFAALVCLLAGLSCAHAAVPVCRAVTGAVVPPDQLPAEQLMTGFADEPGKPAAVQTRAAAFLSRDALTFVVECLEPNLDQLVAKCRQDDAGEVFADDCVEVFVAPNPAAGYFHFATNAVGARFDERGRGDIAWNGKWTAQATRGADRWTVTISLPLATLGGAPRSGAVWWFNVCRQRQPGGLQLSAWSPTRANFHDTSRFAALTFDDACVGYLAAHCLEPFDRRAGQMRKRARIVASAAKALDAALQPVEQSLQPLREAARARRPVGAGEFGALLAAGQAALAKLVEAETSLNEATTGDETAARLQRLARPNQELLAWSTTAITDRRVLPMPEVPRALATGLALRACRGEYEPASLVVYALRGDATIRVRATDLRGPGGAIPSSAVDVRAVKVWYQAGGNERFPINHGQHLLTPELLLRDADLVRIDAVAKRNLVKLQHSDGRVEWLDITGPEPTPEEKDSSAAALPIRDAATLQPVTVPSHTACQLWVTVHVPADAKAGVYRGAIELVEAGRVVQAVPLSLEVLPFDLAPNPLESSIYFHWGLTLDT
ncbi:MAG: carbohydrate-binding family 9-like protein, partial [Armatimonadetes bacterium]|nr:carbohydrate-binding family 9-like protein [Armatimonadota bacterium]